MRNKIKNMLLYISLEELYIRFRKMFCYYFRRKKMMESIAKRKGYCNYKVCGDNCCNYYGCDKFDVKTKKCLVHKNKPEMICKLAPFDENDLLCRLKPTVSRSGIIKQ